MDSGATRSQLNDAGVRPGGQYVLYWCAGTGGWNRNHALAFAAGLANRLELPLLVFESLVCRRRTPTTGFHTFVLEGVPETAASPATSSGIGYVFHLQRGTEPAAGCATVMRARRRCRDRRLSGTVASRSASCRRISTSQCYAVDSSCVVPVRCIGERGLCGLFASARKIHKLLPQFLKPAPHRFDGSSPARPRFRSGAIAELVASCESTTRCRRRPAFAAGAPRPSGACSAFSKHRLRRYAREKNEPSAHATSDLSPYLHFGHISSLEVALAVQEYAAEHKLIADEFLEELIVRRELAFNFARYCQAGG